MKLSEIALMTPYTAQKATLKTMADNAGLLSPQKRPGVTVATITESQGMLTLALHRHSTLEYVPCTVGL